jgi:hypothetical protein
MLMLFSVSVSAAKDVSKLGGSSAVSSDAARKALVNAALNFNASQIKADLASNLSLAAVLQNAMGPPANMTAGDALKEMLAAEPGMSTAMIAAALVVDPESADAILKAANDAGASLDSIVLAVNVASENPAQAEQRLNTLGDAVGGDKGNGFKIAATQQNESDDGNKASLITQAQLATSNSTKSSGGGASAPATVVEELVKIIASIAGGTG